MPVRLTACDSGGKEGVTARAYEVLSRASRRGLHGKFRLVKGTDRIDAPRVVESFPDTRNRSDRNAGSAGDVPVLLNSTLLKDDVMGKVWRTEDGPPVPFPKLAADELLRRVDRGDAQRTPMGRSRRPNDRWTCRATRRRQHCSRRPTASTGARRHRGRLGGTRTRRLSAW